MEAKLFDTPPEWTTAEWYAGREVAPHLEQEGHAARLLLGAKMLGTLDQDLTCVDLGAGDGGLLSILGFKSVWGYDLAPVNVKAAADRGVAVAVADVVANANEIDWGDVAIATEILEHLVDPHTFVREIREHSRYLLASSPYTETAEAHYGFHTWAWDRQGYERMLQDAGWQVLNRGTAWICQVVLCERA